MSAHYPNVSARTKSSKIRARAQPTPPPRTAACRVTLEPQLAAEPERPGRGDLPHQRRRRQPTRRHLGRRVVRASAVPLPFAAERASAADLPGVEFDSHSSSLQSIFRLPLRRRIVPRPRHPLLRTTKATPSTSSATRSTWPHLHGEGAAPGDFPGMPPLHLGGRQMAQRPTAVSPRRAAALRPLRPITATPWRVAWRRIRTTARARGPSEGQTWV